MVAYLCQHNNLQVVYVALNQLLKEQVEEKVKVMTGLNCKVILEQSIGLHLDKKVTFIADEYYAMLSTQKLRVDMTTKSLAPFLNWEEVRESLRRQAMTLKTLKILSALMPLEISK